MVQLWGAAEIITKWMMIEWLVAATVECIQRYNGSDTR